MKINFNNLNPFFRYLRPSKQAIYTTIFFVLIGKIIHLITPILYGKVIDVVIQEKNFTNLVIGLLLTWVLMVILSDWIGRIVHRRSSKIAYNASADAMTQPIGHLLRLPVSFHKNKKIGEIIQRFSRSEQHVYQLTDPGIFEVLPNILASFLAVVVIAWIHWLLALIYLFFVIIYFIVTIIKTDPIVENQKSLNKMFEKIYGDIFDRTPNVISIKSSSNEEMEEKRNIINFKKGFSLYKKHIAMWMSLSFWQRLIFILGFFILFVFSLYYVKIGAITIGQFVVILTYVNILSIAVNSLGSHYKRFQEGIVTIARANKIFNEKQETYADKGNLKPKKITGRVVFKGVGFSYEKQSVLEDISFSVQPNQIVAIIGKSGEGKSTLVNLISRYILPQKGKIFIDEIDIKKINLKYLRDQIAIVPQEINLFNDSIKNNIAYSKIGASESDVIQAAKIAHCHEFISAFPKGYDQIVGEKGIKLSTGQKQRVAIARAILRNPKILILDEATSALDSESEKYVQEAMEEVMRNRTTFVIAHRLSTIRKADLILVLENGKIVESGDHKELVCRGGVYKKLSELQQINV